MASPRGGAVEKAVIGCDA